MSAVLDASALIAYVRDEPGGEAVDVALEKGAFVSAINWAETLSKLTEGGQDAEEAAQGLADAGILGEGLIVHTLDEAQAIEIAKLRPATRQAGLSLGDRACLALAATLELPALTTDHAWADLSLGTRVELIR